MALILLVGNVEPQTSRVNRALNYSDFEGILGRVTDPGVLTEIATALKPVLTIVAGWRHLVPPEVLALAPCVGFHSAKLPEYPGRAPIYWTLLRGDEYVYNTMLYLDEGVDSGDIIDSESRRIRPSDTPATLYEWVAESDARMLTRHLPGLLDGTAPRMPQDMSRRGSVTSKEGYELWRA